MSLEARIDDLEQRIAVLEGRHGASNGALSRSTTGAQQGDVAGDAELDAPGGDRVVRANPKFWTGADMKGRYYSACPSDFLVKLAQMLDYFSKQKAESDPKKSAWDARDARLARGWAKRNKDISATLTSPAEDLF